MRVDVLRQELDRSPFHPFTMFLADGRTYQVRHTECVTLLRTALYLVLVELKKMIVIDPLLIVTIEYENAEGMSLPTSFKRRPRDDDDFNIED